MKMPFDFGVKLIFRLVLPGFVLSLGMLPLMNTALELLGWTARFDAAFVTLIVLLGWLVTISDMSIYMLVEGRRWWPAPLKRFFIKREQQRLRRLLAQSSSADSSLALEASSDLPNFPISDDGENQGEYYIAYPSRLGNLLNAFETYSERIYGLNSIFYWWRIWLTLDKDTREEIDNSQALADSSIYVCLCLLCCGLLMMLYLSVQLLKAAGLRFVPSWQAHLPEFLLVFGKHLPDKASAALLAIVFLAASILVYRLSLKLHGQFGELFKSVIDLNVGKIDVPVIKQIELLTENSPAVSLPRVLAPRIRFQIAVNYLHYYRYYCPNPKCNAFLKPNQIEKHSCLEYHVYQEPSGSWRWRLETITGDRVLVDHGVTYKSEKQCRVEIDLVRQSWDAPVVEEANERPESGSLAPDKAFTARPLSSVNREEE
ncbi:MAG TPA: hypothetical protein VNG71_06360, partial [Pyrinomonadaceae bacterium]|nr:hypothetical protein [Pyrinomonadaceae bacterium]